MSEKWNITPESGEKKNSSGGLHSRGMGCCWLVCQLLRWYRMKLFCYYTWRSI